MKKILFISSLAVALAVSSCKKADLAQEKPLSLAATSGQMHIEKVDYLSLPRFRPQEIHRRCHQISSLTFVSSFRCKFEYCLWTLGAKNQLYGRVIPQVRKSLISRPVGEFPNSFSNRTSSF